MRPLFVDRQILHRGVMALQVLERFKGKRIPHDDVTLLATTGNKAVLARVDECVDSFLMQVECLVLFVLQVLDGVDVNETVQRG